MRFQLNVKNTTCIPIFAMDTCTAWKIRAQKIAEWKTENASPGERGRKEHKTMQQKTLPGGRAFNVI